MFQTCKNKAKLNNRSQIFLKKTYICIYKDFKSTPGSES